MPARSNQEWVTALRGPGPAREAALADLRALVLRALPYALSRWLPAGHPHFPALAEHIAQETLLRVLDRLDSFEGRSRFSTWVYKIAVNLALSELRRRRWQDASLDELLEDGGPEEPGWLSTREAGPESLAERRQALESVRQAILEELTERQRRALLAVAIQGVPMQEAARRLGTNPNALYKLIHDARLRLKRRMEQDGLPVEDLLALFEGG
jgi:RNA polymerase sigma-70 factor, ECF subfamily